MKDAVPEESMWEEKEAEVNVSITKWYTLTTSRVLAFVSEIYSNLFHGIINELQNYDSINS